MNLSLTIHKILNNVPISEYEDVSYDVASLFTNIPIKDTIDFIYEEIYVRKKLELICKKSIFKKLLSKLTTVCTFSATAKLRKQVDGVSMEAHCQKYFQTVS